jgi:hypothetical protein
VTNKFVSVMEAIGRDALKALSLIEEYLPGAATLAELFFPPEAAAIAGVVNATGLIQKAVVLAEQKMAAGNMAHATGQQKASDVLSTVEPTVLQLLTEAGIKNVDTTYVQKIIDAVVADLNVRDSTTAGPAPAAA